MREIICYAARVAIPVWCIVSVLVVVMLIKDNRELGSRLADALKNLEELSEKHQELCKLSLDLIEMDRNEIAIFSEKEAEIEAIREKYEYRIQEVSEYLDSFTERLSKCCDAISVNVQKTNLIDKDVESCSKAIVLLKNELEDIKKKGVTVWDITTSDWFPPAPGDDKNGYYR